MASILIAYACLLCGGWFGLHHLYLGRTYHTILVAITPLTAGLYLLRDFWRLPAYVAACSDAPKERELLEAQMKYSKVPPWSTLRLLAMHYAGNCLWLTGNCLGAESFPSGYFTLTSSVGAALGVWLAGNACTHQAGPLLPAVAVAVVAGVGAGSYQSVAATVAFQWTRRWEPEHKKRQPSRWTAIFYILLFWSVTLYGFYEHGEVTVQTENGPEKHKLKDSIGHILKGIRMEDFQDGFREFNFGNSGSWESFTQRLDVQGERRALRTLEMEDFIGKRYTENDVKRKYKELAKKWHPDHVPLEQKQEAEAKMQDINVAKDLLDKLRKERER
eukprot:TRINITY_DN20692_c0_g2_i1.p1 TRINITY_DN20692_c0_g2~~TRINITY_DN20692_c0_g2_i1.p1  ORF type:complete len:331 (+),score=66.26 TRINITY_DN20692_c0_g2_i1:88-1080(+)